MKTMITPSVCHQGVLPTPLIAKFGNVKQSPLVGRLSLCASKVAEHANLAMCAVLKEHVRVSGRQASQVAICRRFSSIGVGDAGAPAASSLPCYLLPCRDIATQSRLGLHGIVCLQSSFLMLE